MYVYRCLLLYSQAPVHVHVFIKLQSQDESLVCPSTDTNCRSASQPSLALNVLRVELVRRGLPAAASSHLHACMHACMHILIYLYT